MTRTKTTTLAGLRTLALAASLLASAVALTAGSATAHTCAAYDGCDASACKDGEDHDHTDYNYVERDEYCKSTAKPPSDPESCEYFGLEWPPLVCRVIENPPGSTPILPAGGSSPCLERINSKLPSADLLSQHSHRVFDGPC